MTQKGAVANDALAKGTKAVVKTPKFGVKTTFFVAKTAKTAVSARKRGLIVNLLRFQITLIYGQVT